MSYEQVRQSLPTKRNYDALESSFSAATKKLFNFFKAVVNFDRRLARSP
jgi:hypothetical protein